MIDPPHVVVGMPNLSPSMEKGNYYYYYFYYYTVMHYWLNSNIMIIGNITAWKKQEGDKISQGDVIAQIETGK